MLRRRKEKLTVAGAAAAGAWHVYQGVYDDKSLTARFNTAFKDASDVRSHGIQVGVAVPLHDPDERGLPGENELGELDAIEEALLDATTDKAVLVGVITTNSMREFVLYTSEAAWIGPFHHAFDTATSTHEVQVMAKHDPDWTVYREFVR